MTIETEVAKAGIKVTANMILIGLLAVLLLIMLGVGWWFVDDYRELKENAKAHESVETVAAVATDAANTAQTVTHKFEFDVKQTRAASDRNLEELRENDQEVQRFANCIVPDVLREQDEREVSGSEDSPSGSDGTQQED